MILHIGIAVLLVNTRLCEAHGIINDAFCCCYVVFSKEAPDEGATGGEEDDPPPTQKEGTIKSILSMLVGTIF